MWSILEWTAVTAMLCSLAALAHPDASKEMRNFGWEGALTLCMIHGPFAGFCVAELAIVLGMRRPWIGLGLLVPVALALAGLFGWTQGEIAGIVCVAVCLMLWFAIAFVPLRLLGYRFGRCRSTDTETRATDVPEECPSQDQPDLAD